MANSLVAISRTINDRTTLVHKEHCRCLFILLLLLYYFYFPSTELTHSLTHLRRDVLLARVVGKVSQRGGEGVGGKRGQWKMDKKNREGEEERRRGGGRRGGGRRDQRSSVRETRQYLVDVPTEHIEQEEREQAASDCQRVSRCKTEGCTVSIRCTYSTCVPSCRYTMTVRSVFALLLLLLLCSLLASARESRPDSHRRGKRTIHSHFYLLLLLASHNYDFYRLSYIFTVFSLFNIVQFSNDPCTSTETL